MQKERLGGDRVETTSSMGTQDRGFYSPLLETRKMLSSGGCWSPVDTGQGHHSALHCVDDLSDRDSSGQGLLVLRTGSFEGSGILP